MKKFEKIEQCLIPVAGLGSRFLPATKAVPKELFPIENKPALLYHLQEIRQSGIKRVCLVISKEKEIIKDFLKHNERMERELKNAGKLNLLDEINDIIDNLDITFVYQGELNGSGGATYSAKEWAQGKPFALIYGDDLCKTITEPAILQLMKVYEQTGKCVVGAKRFPMEIIHKYSSIITGKQISSNCFEMLDIIEKPKDPPTNLVGLARYIITPDIFDEILKCPRFVNNEIRLTDAIQNLAKQGKTVCCEFDAKYYDCGNKLEYIKCILDYALEDKTISEDLKEYLRNISK